ncbi:MAG: hypothetical protein KatS3mg131_1615 [Candidatus Tectimicrobiota bacterium]|nr:MAG: hypothetical protein KatS3mg131_1615 [Candidatus Tectomicrobia bacterium]
MASLQAGKDLAQQPLSGAPAFCVGAVANPGAADVERELRRMEDKIAAGARFFQTQAVYDSEQFARFMAQAQSFGVPVLAGSILLRSAAMARRLQATLPGLAIPEPLLRELEGAADPGQKGVEIAARLLREIRELCQGVHLMTIGQEHRIPQILHAAGLLPQAPGR